MLDLNNAVLIADVSGWQQADVSCLKGQGFAGIIIKVSERLYASNNLQRQQAESAVSAGLALIGKYAFSVGGTDGAAECDTCVGQLSDLPFNHVIMDAEASTMGPIPSADEVLAFGNRALQWGGLPILYASESPFMTIYNRADIAAIFLAWYAQYDSYAPKTWPSHAPHQPLGAWQEVTGWQFTSVYPSCIGNIDASVFDPAILEGSDDMAQVPQNEWNEVRDYVFSLRDGAPQYGLPQPLLPAVNHTDQTVGNTAPNIGVDPIAQAVALLRVDINAIKKKLGI